MQKALKFKFICKPHLNSINKFYKTRSTSLISRRLEIIITINGLAIQKVRYRYHQLYTNIQLPILARTKPHMINHKTMLPPSLRSIPRALTLWHSLYYLKRREKNDELISIGKFQRQVHHDNCYQGTSLRPGLRRRSHLVLSAQRMLPSSETAPKCLLTFLAIQLIIQDLLGDLAVAISLQMPSSSQKTNETQVNFPSTFWLFRIKQDISKITYAQTQNRKFSLTVKYYISPRN